MPFSSYFFFFLFFLLSTSASNNRRVLHHPFFPINAIPPSHSPPKIPSPFFPSFPFSPPPPSPASFASFPANISSLILPQSPSPKPVSPNLIAAAISAAVSAIFVLGFLVFYYGRRRQRVRRFSEDKNYRPGNSNGLNALNVDTRNASTGSNKLRTRTTSSSEFLYLGTLFNSCSLDEASNHNDNGTVGSNPIKLDLPELLPLPPLNRRSSRLNFGNCEDDVEEFYSPRGSLGGKESSTGTGSGSRRTFGAVGKEDSDAGTSSSSSYPSSTTSESPARSESLSISPPASSSPHPKSPESNVAPPSPPQMPLHYNRRKSLSPSISASSPNESPRISFNLESNVQSSSLASLPENSLQKSAGSSLQTLNQLDQNMHSPSLSPAMIFNISDQNRYSPFPDSPEKSLISSPSASNRDVSLPHMSSASTSPDRILEKIPSPTISDRSILSPLPSLVSSSSASSSPSKVSQRNSNSVPLTSGFGHKERIGSVLQQPISATPPPPPPPTLPPQRNSPPVQPVQQGKQCELPKPPLLIPPSRPSVLQGKSIELPPSMENGDGTPKPKLKPLHWDKVRASSDRQMVWDQLRSSSFKLNEEMMESLFTVNTPNAKPNHTTPWTNQENRILDPKKAQNIAILLRALNVTVDEVCEALLQGTTETLGTEVLESLLKMAPTKEEERKLKEYKENDSPTKLGHAEKFLKAVLDVPFAFKRVDVMLYITNFASEVEHLKRSFDTLEAACEELRSCRMFLKLLETVLKTGNRMNIGTNRGDAQAFKLDTLVKLVDVKGVDGKTTLLHFVVQEITRTEGARLSGPNNAQNPSSSDDIKCRKLGLEVVSGLSSELANVKKAAAMDSDVLSNDVSKLSQGIDNINEVVRLIESMNLDDFDLDESSHKFSDAMKRFMRTAEEEIIKIQASESVALSLVKEITEYFHGNSAKEEAHPFRIFMVVRDFLGVLDRGCKEVGMINERTIVSSAHKFPVPVNPTLPPGSIRKQYSSSDDENASP